MEFDSAFPVPLLLTVLGILVLFGGCLFVWKFR